MRVLFVNPPIYDFAAFDLWAKPLGLLYLAAAARASGAEIALLDFLDVQRYSDLDVQAGLRPPVIKRFGTAQYPKHPVPWPFPTLSPRRTYFRYGISREHAAHLLASMPPPHLVVVTSHFTYTYPGVQEAIALSKQFFPHTPVWLGGTYPQLCPEHAEKHSGADLVLTSTTLDDFITRLVALDTSLRVPARGFARFVDWPSPALDLYPRLSYLPWRTSRGCVNTCAYCAAPYLSPQFEECDPVHSADQLLALCEHFSVDDVAFYDDALLVNASSRLVPFLSRAKTARPTLRWHTPNGLHIRLISPELAQHMRAAGFVTLRLGLETLNPSRLAATGPKYAYRDLTNCIAALVDAGFTLEQIGVYVLMGLPGQSAEEVRTTIRFVYEHFGIRVKLAEYSPAPRTRLWPAAVAESKLPITDEPLFHNNSLLSLRSPVFTEDVVQELRALARPPRVNRSTPLP